MKIKKIDENTLEITTELKELINKEDLKARKAALEAQLTKVNSLLTTFE